MRTDVLDFTDLGKGTQFKYNGLLYEIPSYTRDEMDDLMEVSEKMVMASKALSAEDKEKMKDSENKDREKEQDIKSDEMKKFFSIQQEFIVIGVRKVKDTVIEKLVLEDIKSWPWKLCNKIISMIQEMMTSISEVEKEKGGRKNPT